MGDRGQIEFIMEEGSLYFYTHWRASELPDLVRAALARSRERWDQPDYLTRIIVSEVMVDEIRELTGYGFALSPYVDAWRTVVINLGDNEVAVHDDDDVDSDEFFSFEDFVANRDCLDDFDPAPVGPPSPDLDPDPAGAEMSAPD